MQLKVIVLVAFYFCGTVRSRANPRDEGESPKMEVSFNAFFHGSFEASISVDEAEEHGHSTTTSSTTTTTNSTNLVDIVILPVYTAGKVLIANGWPFYSANKTEVIDINGERSCKQQENATYRVVAATGQLMKGGPIICGGRLSDDNITNYCSFLGHDTFFIKMIEKRAGLASIAFDSAHILVSGGFNGSAYSRTTEIINTYGLFNINYGPSMPVGLQGHCFLKISDDEAMIIGGKTGDNMYTNEVWFLNLVTSVWRPGPSMSRARSEHACGVYYSYGYTYVVVTGGYTYNDEALSSTEIMIVPSGLNWYSGPELPMKVWGLNMVTASNGSGVVVTGGWDKASINGNFYELSCYGYNCNNWVQLSSKLSVPRYGAVAFSVPDDFC